MDPSERGVRNIVEVSAGMALAVMAADICVRARIGRTSGDGMVLEAVGRMADAVAGDEGILGSPICVRLVALAATVPIVGCTERFFARRCPRWIPCVMTVAGIAVFLLSALPISIGTAAYAAVMAGSYLLALAGGIMLAGRRRRDVMRDVFNLGNESFLQDETKRENDFSVNIATEYTYHGKTRRGWINVVNPFRATVVLGTPGSGKTYSVVYAFIQQMIEKGFAMYIYDFKYDDLSVQAYNHFLRNRKAYPEKARFCLIDFDDPLRSMQCNPLAPELMTDISDAYESAYTIMLNLNRSWIQKQGDFFVESPIVLLAAVIWFLKLYRGGKYCTFPHAIELLGQPYEQLFRILEGESELRSYMSPFLDAWKGGAQEQLQGQLASAKIPLSRLASPQLYWVMSGSDFTLDINNPESPKILCIGNNPDRQNIYSAALGLYNTRIVRLMNRKGQRQSGVVIDELPTIYFRGLDNLIATARSNRVAVCLGFQDFSQLRRDYGERESRVIENTVGNIFSGQVAGETAKALSLRFGRILQQREGSSVSRQGISESVSTQMDTMIPIGRISNLSQGRFVGSVSDDFRQPIERKVFNARIRVDPTADVRKWEKCEAIPQIPDLRESFRENPQWAMETNFDQIRKDVRDIVRWEMNRLGLNAGEAGATPPKPSRKRKGAAEMDRLDMECVPLEAAGETIDVLYPKATKGMNQV